ncbi:NAD(P)/FAD-dependent oxidoreductase [Pseudonocardia sp. GCM10023141]|uniref:NAD(P)/FAD-dependent oxidoreductase n=1 Tax=Pseudonocardia sp. GCM10023141 TaxID=3252653 RepID=UPI00361053BC
MPTDQRTFAIVGAGLAGAKAAEALREQDFHGRIVLFGDEQHRPYERPPLSKGYLQGSAERESAFVHPEQWYAEHVVELRLDDAVTAIARTAHELRTASGSVLHYDKLLLATGARPRQLRIPGAELANVHHLRTIDDSEDLKAAFRPGARVVIIGGGWIGLETAAAARTAGAEVVVLEQAALPLLGVLGPKVAQVFADLHVEHGVDLRCEVGVAEIRAGSVVLADGAELPADIVVVGVGVEPNVELAREGGLDVDNGVLVDEHLQTSDADILAAGDVANSYHPLLQRRLRVEHWANALNQPAVAAQTMLGIPASYDRLPYFFTDQYDLGMEYTGYAEPGGYDDVVIRGELAKREFVAFWLRDGRVLAGMNVNVWDVTGPIGDLIRGGRRVDPAVLADPDVPIG